MMTESEPEKKVKQQKMEVVSTEVSVSQKEVAAVRFLDYQTKTKTKASQSQSV